MKFSKPKETYKLTDTGIKEGLFLEHCTAQFSYAVRDFFFLVEFLVVLNGLGIDIDNKIYCLFSTLKL